MRLFPKIFLLILVYFALFNIPRVFGADLELSGFRGMNWGSKINASLGEFSIISADKDIILAVKNKDTSSIFGVPSRKPI